MLLFFKYFQLFSFLICIFMTISTYIGYKNKVYCQLFASYGFLLMAIAFAFHVMMDFMITGLAIIHPTATIILRIIFILIVILGGALAIFGSIKERSKKKS